MQTPREDRREQARIVASFAEYLAEDVRDHPDHALEAMASLAEWCEGDDELLAEARADVLRERDRDAAGLLELVAEAS